MRSYDPDGGKWAGIERALRAQAIQEGNLPPDHVTEATGASATLCLELAEEFSRTFTEERLGIALNYGDKGRVIVKRCVQGSAAASRRIPPGAFVTRINGELLNHKSLEQVQQLIQKTPRPIRIDFEQSESSRTFAEGSRRQAAHEVEAEKAAQDALVAARRAAEIERHTTKYETAETFSRTFTDERLGICLGDGGGPGRTFVRKCLPGSAAFKAGVPPDVCITAINGKSVEFRRFKEVKKLLQIASRPVTVDFSREETPNFPLDSGRIAPAHASSAPSYVLRQM